MPTLSYDLHVHPGPSRAPRWGDGRRELLAYRLVQGHAMRAWKEGLNFRALVTRDKSITGRVPREQVERAFELKRQLRNVGKIFARVFPSTTRGTKVHQGKTRAHTRKKKPRGA